MLIRDAEIGGRRLDLRCRDGRIVEIERGLRPQRAEPELEARGGALIPGLHDHHIHLFSLAAAMQSIVCGPPEVSTRAALIERLAGAEPPTGWLRGTGYFESVAGPLDRDVLDAWVPDRPVRIQHRSGAMWFLNSRALETLVLRADERPAGLEFDERGRATGRLFRADAWLRERLPDASRPALEAVGRRLAAYGVTGITEATPTNTHGEVSVLRAAQASGALPQRVRLMGGAALDDLAGDAQLSRDAHKLLFDEAALPEFEALVETIRAAHAAARGIAIHSVTRTQILFALAAIEAAGPDPRDRLEHASIAPPEAIEQVARLDVRIVTQPNFVSERGDAYRQHVEAADQPHLYRLRSWLEHEVVLAAGTDAPFGDPDPWKAMRAAVLRRTTAGELLGASERVSPEVAIDLFHADRLNEGRAGPGAAGEATGGAAPRGPVPRVGDRADLCLLAVPWREAREALSSEQVVATLRDGCRIHPLEG